MENFFYESEHYKFHFENGILKVTYVKGPISLKTAKDVVKKRLELTNNQPVLLLVDDEGLKSIDREARVYLSSDEGVQSVTAAALLIKNSFSKHLANFFLKISVNRPKFPAKVFSNEHEAIEWLKENDIA